MRRAVVVFGAFGTCEAHATWRIPWYGLFKMLHGSLIDSKKASQKFAEDPQFQVSQPRSCCQELEEETPGVTAASRCELIVLSALISSWSTAWRAWRSSCSQPGDQYTLLKGLR